MEVTDKEFSSKILSNMYKSWKEELYCDVTLKCGSRSLKAHKIILAAMSEYFKNIFKYKLNDEEFDLDTNIFKEEFYEQIVEFAYTGKMKIDGDYVQDLVVAASFLQIQFIQEECEKFISSNIDIENIMPLVSFSNRVNLFHLFDSTCVFISDNFYTLHKNGAFWLLELDELNVLLKNVNFTVFEHGVPVQYPELEILKLIGMYLSVTSASKKDFKESVIPELLQTVHFEEILDVDDVKSILDVFPILDCSVIQDVINKSSDLVTSDNNRRKFSNSCKKLKPGRRLADGSQENHVLEEFDESWKNGRDLNDRPIKFRVFVRRWDGWAVVGGIAVEYKSGKIVQHGGKPDKESIFVSEHEFSLQDNEVITKVIVRSGWMINSVRFFSNFGTEFGPFGGEVGGFIHVESLSGEMGYVHSLSGKVVLAQQFLAITFLQFNWVVYGDSRKMVEAESDVENIQRMSVIIDSERDDAEWIGDEGEELDIDILPNNSGEDDDDCRCLCLKKCLCFR